MKAHFSRRAFIKQSAAVTAGAALAGSGCSNPGHQKKVDFFFDMVDKRRSVRSYKSTPVPQDHIDTILHAARMAPTAGNRQPWKFVLMQKPESIERLIESTINLKVTNEKKKKKMTEKEETELRTRLMKSHSGYFSAPVYIGILTDSKARFARMNSHDGPLAAGYLCLAARALGYGTVYLTGSIPGEAFRKAANVPERYRITCVIPLGVPEEWPDTPPKKKFEELVVNEAFK